MFLSKKLSHFSALTILLFIAAIPVTSSAQNSKNNKKGKSVSRSVSAAKPVKLVQSSETIDLTLENGESASIPRVDKIVADAVIPKFNVTNQLFNETPSSSSLLEKLAEQKEIEELSGILGVSITDATHLDLYREIADWLGTRYRRGGMSRKAVDCSGFTNIIYKNVFGLQLDRVSTVIAKNLKVSVPKEELEPGDMVFFSTFGKKYINHVGVYLGDGLFAHASIKKGVIVSTLKEGYYSKAWRKGGRMVETE